MVKIHVPKGPVEAAYESPDAKSSQCPENHPDFATIRVVSRVVLFVLHKCWMTCGVSFVTVFVVYWYCSSVLALLLLFFSLSGLVYQLGDWLLYHPEQPPHSRLYVPSPSLVGLPCWEAPPVHTRDALRLHALFVRQPPDRFGQAPTLLYLHGNAGNIGHRLHNVAGLFHQCGCNVLLVEYRGYGRSEGTPSEEGLYRDAQAGLDFLAQHPGLDATKLLVFGRSLGGAVALDLASRPEHACRLLGIVVENTFCSVPEVGRLLFGWLRWLPDFCFKSQSHEEASNLRVWDPQRDLAVQGILPHLEPLHQRPRGEAEGAEGCTGVAQRPDVHPHSSRRHLSPPG
ncbi:abhydrolase domain-containing protein, putative [Ixodes scapularis]|uniref:Abhydrolase domain-containing protein, putative n=1 Tax=Ixodes scapularis TaxID=6945 RepID=B7QCC3_IXOSC|nr:abhydrolase domain-containing protein, putative [Ixodes scapularis]|eukprot:XP_002413187.1 abhydrolase domain-containing protein, putative [Ixodes scapularis]